MSNWIEVMGWVSRGVLGVLFGLSIWSVAIMLDRVRLYRALRREDRVEDAVRMIQSRNWRGLDEWIAGRHGPRAGVLRVARELPEQTPELIDRAVRSYLAGERSIMENGLTSLATLGSNAPFIGLFGTVLGIIQAFGVLAETQYSSTAVMKGISEALFATAVGLFVAIPAVIAFNFFNQRLRSVLAECEAMRDLYISRACQKGD